MRILVSGASGLVGSALVAQLVADGHVVVPLVREALTSAREAVLWQPAEGTIDASALEGFDAVVHLAGENIAARRWTTAQKQRIRESRVGGTRLLADALARTRHPPKVLVGASAIGYYGDRGAELLPEESGPGNGFLPAVCVAWEAAAAPVETAGIRLVSARFGVILSPEGGALAKMLGPFRLGCGGRIGNGRQYWSWIALRDAVGAIRHALATESLQGPVNVVAPQPVTNREFTRILTRVLGRPAFIPLPAFAARLALGEMADALLLASSRVEPARLTATGFAFEHPELEGALRALLADPRSLS